MKIKEVLPTVYAEFREANQFSTDEFFIRKTSSIDPLKDGGGYWMRLERETNGDCISLEVFSSGYRARQAHDPVVRIVTNAQKDVTKGWEKNKGFLYTQDIWFALPDNSLRMDKRPVRLILALLNHVAELVENAERESWYEVERFPHGDFSHEHGYG